MGPDHISQQPSRRISFPFKMRWKRGTGRMKDLLVSVLGKAGKADHISRRAARGCACALIPVAILPLLRHRKQTQFLVSPSLGGGAF